MNMKSMLCSLVLSGLVLSSVFVSGCLSPATGRDQYGLISFSSEKDLENYLNRFGASADMYGGITGAGIPSPKVSLETARANFTGQMTPMAAADSGVGTAGRYSGTNVRTASVDEADVVKTDGNYIYYCSQNYYYVTDGAGLYTPVRKTYIIDALPPEAAAIVAAIEDDMYVSGLYLLNNSVILIGSDEIKCYDVSDPEHPRISWREKMGGYYKDSRLSDGILYLITMEYQAEYPILYGDDIIPAKRVYVPFVPSIVSNDVSVTYFLTKIDLSDGTAKDTIAVLGGWDMKIYVSETNAYLASHYMPDERLINLHFIQERGDEFLPSDVMSKIKRILNSEDFGDNAKYLEIDETVAAYLGSLPADEAYSLSEEMGGAFETYYSDALRKEERTVISRINLSSFELTTGSLPGALLNDYSIDEYDGCLRAAATIGNDWRVRDESTNAVYIFDDSMTPIGQLTGIAKGERIYSALFAGDTLYMVTFKETDPFFVIDLSRPESPSILGELKIPGYSSYLHPIGNDLVIGVGMIDGSTKVSLFSIADLSNPIEVDSLRLDAYSSAIHDFHAFLWDGDTNTLVIPAEEHAYILNVDASGISLKKDDIHENAWVSRTLYINDCLYTFSDRFIHVIDMETWETVNVIDIPEPVYPDRDAVPAPADASVKIRA